MANIDTYQVLRYCASDTSVAQIKFNYNDYTEMLFPLLISNELFLSVVDRDFILDGYTIRRISDIIAIKEIKQTYLKIHIAEGNIKKLKKPNVDVTSFATVFNFLLKSNEYAIIEGIVPNNDNAFFLVGKTVAVGDKSIRFRTFDGAGNWCDNLITVPFASINAITFRSSYVKTYSKYVKPYLENHN